MSIGSLRCVCVQMRFWEAVRGRLFLLFLQISFSRHLAFTERRLFDWNTTPSRFVCMLIKGFVCKCRVPHLTCVCVCVCVCVKCYYFCYSLPAGFQRLLLGLFFALLYSVLNQYFPMSLLVSQEFEVRKVHVHTWHTLMWSKFQRGRFNNTAYIPM